MVNTYVVQSKIGLILGTIAICLMSCLWLVVAFGGQLWAWVPFVLTCYSAYRWVARHPHAITVEDWREVVIHYLWWRKRFAFRDLRGVYWKITDHGDRELRVYYVSGVAYLPEFGRADELVADLRNMDQLYTQRSRSA